MSFSDAKLVTVVDTQKPAVEYKEGDTVELSCEYAVLPNEDQPPIIYWIKVWQLQHTTQSTTYCTTQSCMRQTYKMLAFSKLPLD